MNTDRINTHVPFCDLVPQEMFFYWVAATTALEELYPWSPGQDEICAALACIWDGEELTIAETIDSSDLSERMVLLLFKFAGKEDRARIMAENPWKSYE